MRVEARCLIEVVSGASCIFLLNFHTKWLLWNVHVHFDCAGSHKMPCPGLGSGIFLQISKDKMALVKCPCAFRLRRLAQNAVPGIGVRHFPLNFHTKWLLWNVHVHFDRAGSHKMPCPGLGSGIFPLDFYTKWLLWNVHVHFDCAGSHKMPCPGLGSGIFPWNF